MTPQIDPITCPMYNLKQFLDVPMQQNQGHSHYFTLGHITTSLVTPHNPKWDTYYLLHMISTQDANTNVTLGIQGNLWEKWHMIMGNHDVVFLIITSLDEPRILFCTQGTLNIFTSFLVWACAYGGIPLSTFVSCMTQHNLWHIVPHYSNITKLMQWTMGKSPLSTNKHFF